MINPLLFNLAGPAGIEPASSVLETPILPLYDGPMILVGRTCLEQVS